MSNILTNNINPRSGNLITIGGTNDRVSIAGTLTYEDVSNIDSVGIITARDGLDTPTNLVLRTGGTEKVRIDSSGNMGIGTSSPNTALHVRTSTGTQLNLERTSPVSAFSLKFTRGNRTEQGIFTDGAGIGLRAEDATNGATQVRLAGQNTDANDYDRIEFTVDGTERMRIDSSGRMLLGTSTARTIVGFVPSLQTEGTASDDSALSLIRNTNNDGPSRLLFGKSRGSALGSNTIVSENDALGIIHWTGADGTDLNSRAAQISCEVDGTPGANDMPGRLLFSTTADGASSPTERMRIDNAGKVYFGNFTNVASAGYIEKITSGDYELNISSTRSTAARRSIVFQVLAGEETMRISENRRVGIHNTTSGAAESLSVSPTQGSGDQYCIITSLSSTGSSFHYRMLNGNGVVGSIKTSGSSTSFNTSSDYRLKENVVDITDGITRIKQLQPKRFNFIADADKTVDGFIAHEAQTVVPEAVAGEKDATKEEQYEVTPAVLNDDGEQVTPAVMGTRTVPEHQGIDQSKLVPLLTAALQEAIAKIETLEQRLSDAGL